MRSPIGKKSVVLLGPFGFGNLGDAAIQDAVIQNLKRLRPALAIWGVSLNPDDTRARHGIETFPLNRSYRPRRTQAPVVDFQTGEPRRRVGAIKRAAKKIPIIVALHRGMLAAAQRCSTFIKELRHCRNAYRFLKKKDLLIFSGGGQLDEYWGGPWEQPYAILKWALLASLRRAKVVFLSVGVGNVEHPLTRWFIKSALLLAYYRTFRDQGSRQLVESRVGVRRGNRVVPDLAYSYSWMPLAELGKARGDGLTVGLGPMSYFDPRGYAWPEKNGEVYCRYVAKLACFSAWLLQQGYRIVFFTGEAVHDRPVVQDIRDAILISGVRPAEDQIQEENIEDVRDLLTQLWQTDVVLASRFHGVLLAHLLLKPVLAISYERKVRTLMREMGHEQYCVDIETFDVEELKTLFIRLLAARKQLKKDLSEKLAEYRQVIGRQYPRILTL